jgi:hypothetical protein
MSIALTQKIEIIKKTEPAQLGQAATVASVSAHVKVRKKCIIE